MLTLDQKPVAHRCTKASHLSPNTLISLSAAHSIHLKTRVPQNENRSTNQKVGGSNPSGRAIFINLPKVTGDYLKVLTHRAWCCCHIPTPCR